MSAPALLDLSRLEIALGGDASLIRDILEMYETTAAEDLASLEQAVAAGDPDATTRKAHSLKGASANVGAEQVADVASRIEQFGRSGDVAGASALRDELRRTFLSTVDACGAHRAA